MISLRNYQEEAVTKAVEHLKSKSNQKPIIIAPTGSGKSIIIASIAQQLTGRVLIFQPSIELLKQNYEKYRRYADDARIYSASAGEKQHGRVTYATIGSIRNHQEFQNYHYCIIDECNLVPPNSTSMYQKVFSQIPNLRVLGLTATPYRLKTYNYPNRHAKINLLTREKPRFFTSFLHITQISDLLEQGYLSPIKYIPIEFDPSRLRSNTTGSDFSDKSVSEALQHNKVAYSVSHVVSQAIQKGRNRILVFVPNIAMAESLANKDEYGVAIHGGLNKKKREDIVNNFKRGNIKVVYNVNILTTGFDYPELDTIIGARPTKSMSLYYQMIGRGMRIAEGKEYCAYVDLVGNYKRFGKVEDWKLERHDTYWVIHNGKKILTGVEL